MQRIERRYWESWLVALWPFAVFGATMREAGLVLGAAVVAVLVGYLGVPFRIVVGDGVARFDLLPFGMWRKEFIAAGISVTRQFRQLEIEAPHRIAGRRTIALVRPRDDELERALVANGASIHRD